MVVVPRDNDLLAWSVVIMVGAGINDTPIIVGNGRGREITIVFCFAAPGPRATAKTVMVVMMVVVVMAVRCASMIIMVICMFGRRFSVDVYLACSAHHRTTTHSVSIWDRRDSIGDPAGTNEKTCEG
jgi:hypothetical protein